MENENLEIQDQNIEQTADENLEIDNSLEQKEEQQESNLFDPSKITFDEQTSFNGYDLSSLKEKIDTSEDSVKALETYTSKFQELGLSQEQVLGIVSFMAEQGAEAQTPDEIKSELSKHLTFEEKRAYQANCNLLQNALKGTPEEKFFNAIASDPYAIKVLGRVINYARGGNNVSAAKTERETREAASLTGYEAVEQYNKYLAENLGYSNQEAKQKELLAKLAKEEDKKYFKEVLGL